jgi:hypothetical protein
MSNRVIGNTVNVEFSSLGDTKCISGKIDTGATNSSLHALDIKINGDNSVTFNCPVLSDNSITMELSGSQEVLSADAGGQQRPVIHLDVCIDGVKLPNVTFNLNDRSEMDSPILIGQNILKAGDFIIDVNKCDDEDTKCEAAQPSLIDSRHQKILTAVKILKENDVTIYELVEFLRTAPIYLRDGE